MLHSQLPLVGSEAPDFTAEAVFDQEFQTISLSQFRVGHRASTHVIWLPAHLRPPACICMPLCSNLTLTCCYSPKGKYVVLFFYPLDFTFVCPTEITAFSDQHPEFAKINTEVCLSRVLAPCPLHAIKIISSAPCCANLKWPTCSTRADPGRVRGLALLPPGLGADR